MMRLYEDIIRATSSAAFARSASFERDIGRSGGDDDADLEGARGGPLLSRVHAFFSARLHACARSLRTVGASARSTAAIRKRRRLDESCIIGWHSMPIRSHGLVAPCCILPTKVLGDIFKSRRRTSGTARPTEVPQRAHRDHLRSREMGSRSRRQHRREHVWQTRRVQLPDEELLLREGRPVREGAGADVRPKTPPPTSSSS